MQTLKAGFLFVGSWNQKVEEWGGYIASDLTTARLWLDKTDYDVLILTLTNILEKKFPELFRQIKERHPATQIIAAIPSDFPPEKLAELHNQYSFFRVVDGTEDTQLEAYLYAAIEEANQRKQDENLIVLIREQTTALQKLQIELEQRVEKRTRFLTEARRKLFITNTRIEGLKKVLITVHQSNSVAEIESLLVTALATTVDTAWIRIFFTPQDALFEDQIKKDIQFASLKVELFKNHIKMGSLFFMRAPDRIFNKDEISFLQRVGETVSLALDRIQKLHQIENIKEQWETTFDSMSEPVLLIDTNYDILQSNQSIKDSSSARGKCYESLFGRSKPCEHCKRGFNFRMETPHIAQQGEQILEVFSQSLMLDPQAPPVFVNQYHDITEQSKMEKQILESARMAELGTIGSSIAHELNNPLAGIISFTQLIKMDLPKDHPLYPDILEMETGALRCKEIIQNLLGFTRDPGSDTEKTFELREVIQRALKITELKTKSAGIRILGTFTESSSTIKGHFNLLSQAFKNILQTNIDRLLELKRENNSLPLEIYIDIVEEPEKTRIFIRNTNTITKQENKLINTPVGLALPVAQQILRDHHAELIFEANETGLYLAKISFSRLVLGS